MKILFLTNNSVALPLANWLKTTGVEVFITGDKITADTIEAYSPEWILSYNYRHIIKEDIIELCPGRVLNFHASLLPWNRGADPNLWSFLEDTPKGITIHLIDKGVDTGPVLVRKELEFDVETETLESSYARLQDEIQSLFRENWESIKAGLLPLQPQPSGGSKHFLRDSEEFKRYFGESLFKVKCSELKCKYDEYKNSLKK